MVNWDPKALTALSDEEVIYKEQQGKLYYLKYKLTSLTPAGGKEDPLFHSSLKSSPNGGAGERMRD